MDFIQSFKKFSEIAKQKNLVLFVSLIYNFIWAVCKILFGVFTSAYFFCVSGASTLLFGFIKQVYLKHIKTDDEQLKKGKSITIAILLIVSSALFTFYMARLFFIDEVSNYGLIMSITIASFSFSELGISITEFVKARKTDDLLLQSFKGCSLASSLFAIVLTQVALLLATGSSNNFFNELTGSVMGIFSILIGVYLIVNCYKTKTNIKS